ALARLYEISHNAGVELRVGDYGWRKPERPRLGQYQITLPVAGNYAQIRSFAETALLEIPTLSLDQINFRRKRVSDAQVEAEIRMTLYLPAS
ncbi:MAG: pilus assembly protein PilO, partial [Actinomycetota bacterium]